jgi:hypothetical protein
VHREDAPFKLVFAVVDIIVARTALQSGAVLSIRSTANGNSKGSWSVTAL